MKVIKLTWDVLHSILTPKKMRNLAEMNSDQCERNVKKSLPILTLTSPKHNISVSQ